MNRPDDSNPWPWHWQEYELQATRLLRNEAAKSAEPWTDETEGFKMIRNDAGNEAATEAGDSREQPRLGCISIATHQLICQQENGLDSEFPVAKVEQILEAGAQQLHDHHVVLTLNAKPFDLRDAI